MAGGLDGGRTEDGNTGGGSRKDAESQPLTSQYGDLAQILIGETDLAFSRHFMAICWKIVIMVL